MLLLEKDVSAVIGFYGLLLAAAQKEEKKQLVSMVRVASPTSAVCILHRKKEASQIYSESLVTEI